ncbi:MAG: hypothetical protein ACREBV_10685, partial [Candidatus Zixiibacteriota bacterium]
IQNEFFEFFEVYKKSFFIFFMLHKKEFCDFCESIQKGGTRVENKQAKQAEVVLAGLRHSMDDTENKLIEKRQQFDKLQSEISRDLADGKDVRKLRLERQSLYEEIPDLEGALEELERRLHDAQAAQESEIRAEALNRYNSFAVDRAAINDGIVAHASAILQAYEELRRVDALQRPLARTAGVTIPTRGPKQTLGFYLSRLFRPILDTPAYGPRDVGLNEFDVLAQEADGEPQTAPPTAREETA